MKVFLKARNAQGTIAENPEMKINSFQKQKHESSNSYLNRQRFKGHRCESDIIRHMIVSKF